MDLGNDSKSEKNRFCLFDLAFSLFPVELGSQVDMAVLEREHSQGAT